MRFPLTVISLISSSNVHTIKHFHVHAVYSYSLSIDKQLATYQMYQAIEYLQSLLEYHSLQDACLLF